MATIVFPGKNLETLKIYSRRKSKSLKYGESPPCFLDKILSTYRQAYLWHQYRILALCTISKIDDTQINLLQENLVRSHACGIGETIPDEIVKLMLLLKILSLSKGHSGVQPATVELLIEFYNNEIYPVTLPNKVPLGSSGDLIPLAHLSLPLMGEGEVIYQGQKYSGAEILKKFGWKKIPLQAKEGLPC